MSSRRPGSGRWRVSLFGVALPLCAAIATLGILYPDHLSMGAQRFTATAFSAIDWFFMASVSAFLVFCVVLATSKYGRLRLGQPGDRPEFSTASWLSMLFAAGMGVGLLFWGVAEPMTHYLDPPGLTPRSAQAARQGMVLTLFHWGLHAWAVYAVGALVLAYFGFRRGTPYLAGAPLRAEYRGRWVEPAAKTADFIAVVAVAFGVAGSIAMGVMQFQTGLHVVAGTPLESTGMSVLLLAVLFLAYTASAATSLDKGIQILSNLNMVVAVLLLLFVLLAGPTGFLLRGAVTLLSDYTSQLVGLSLRLYPYQGVEDWVQSWTLTYFIWWIAWAPFVGIFIARISRGRTIREFVLGVLAAPTGFSMLWFAVFGGSGLWEEAHGAGGIASVVTEDVALALFTLLERLPAAELLLWTAVALIFVFLVTSVDSATFVLGMLTSGGATTPPTSRKLAWGVSLGLLGGALLLSGNINVVRAVTISGSLPFTLVLLLQMVALIRALARERDPVLDRPRSATRRLSEEPEAQEGTP